MWMLLQMLNQNYNSNITNPKHSHICTLVFSSADYTYIHPQITYLAWSSNVRNCTVCTVQSANCVACMIITLPLVTSADLLIRDLPVTKSNTSPTSPNHIPYLPTFLCLYSTFYILPYPNASILSYLFWKSPVLWKIQILKVYTCNTITNP